MTALGFFTRLLDEAPAGQRYRNATEQIRHAEQLGFATAWVAQHHFHGPEGGLPSPLVFLSHVGALTSTIRLGTGVITIPMEDAVRTAEDAVVLDELTDGRVEVGIATGGFGCTSGNRPLGQSGMTGAAVHSAGRTAAGAGATSGAMAGAGAAAVSSRAARTVEAARFMAAGLMRGRRAGRWPPDDWPRAWASA